MTGKRRDINRSPKACHHKIANHQHGTRVCYVADHCRCSPCTEANRAEQSARELAQLFGRYNRLTDADPVRAHIEDLRAQGMGRRRIATAAGLTQSSLHKLIYGKRRPDGTRTPARRILKVNADAILAITFTPAPRSAAETGLAFGASRRIRALVALGYPLIELGRRLDGNDPLVRNIAHGRGIITVSAAQRVAVLYDQLSMSLPPQSNRFERASITRAKKFANARGWQPPLAIDDETLDDPFDGGVITIDLPDVDVDHVAIERRMAGDKTIRLSKAESAELRTRWVASGRPLNELERITGLNSSRYKKVS